MIKSYKLSCLGITGKLDDNTPTCVIKEICNIYGIDLKRASLKQIQEIDKLQPSITLPLGKDDLVSVSKFINPFVTWTKDSLVIAFDFLRKFMGNEEIELPEEINFGYGLQTPQTPCTYSACVLYRLCKYLALPISKTHTKENMAYGVKLLLCSEGTGLHFLSSELSDLSKGAISTIYLHLQTLKKSSSHLRAESPEYKPECSIPKCSYTDICNSLIELDNSTNLLLRVTPQKPSEAIVIAAKVYSLDISEADDPLGEFFNLKERPEEWIPKDAKLFKKVQEDIYSLRLDSRFNPKLPEEIYERETLRDLALMEGYSRLDLRSEGAYTLLCTAYLSETFYEKAYNNTQVLNETTPIYLEEVEDLSSSEVIYYGVLNFGLHAVTYDGLAEHFTKSKNFSSPFSDHDECFTSVAMKKLKNICSRVGGNEPLLRAIEYVEIFVDSNNERVRELFELYDSSSRRRKESIMKLLYKFLDIGMYMRGWDGEGEYPVRRALVAEEEKSNVDIRVTHSIFQFEEMIEEVDEDIREMIEGMPLFRFRGEWQAAIEEDEGTTIRDRLDIIKRGEAHENYNSCIRLSSNWVVSTAYRYLQVFGEVLDFDIDDLREIS